jgi:DNA-binding NarL/FixJ family response regulator
VLLWSAVRIYRDGLSASLTRDPRIGHVASVAEPTACRHAVAQAAPDVAVIDAGSPAGVEVADELRACGVGVVALGITVAEADVVAFAEAGVSAYLTQEQTLDDLVLAILAVARGETDCGPGVTALLLRHVAATARDSSARDERTVRLTRRELEILQLMTRGLTNKQIGLKLSIELPTVKNHVHHILEKLQVHRRGEAAARANGRA